MNEKRNEEIILPVSAWCIQKFSSVKS